MTPEVRGIGNDRIEPVQEVAPQEISLMHMDGCTDGCVSGSHVQGNRVQVHTGHGSGRGECVRYGPRQYPRTTRRVQDGQWLLSTGPIRHQQGD